MNRIFCLIRMTTILGLSMMTPVSFANAGELVREEAVRQGKWEILLSPQYTLAKNLGFDGGTTAKVNGTWGFGLQIGYNFTEHLNLAGYFSWTQPDYQAVVQPAPGNSGPARNISGSLQMNTLDPGRSAATVDRFIPHGNSMVYDIQVRYWV
ncbi:MAG: hypothetical protein NTNFB02_32520 [Nitrospira sp.]